MGSGKSTIIKSLRTHKVNGFPIDFGIYINADDIAVSLSKGLLDFKQYRVLIDDEYFHKTSVDSGLINANYPEDEFTKSYLIENNKIVLKTEARREYLAQVIAHVLREKLLIEKKKFSFETVFSHSSKVDIMRRAKEQGYKVYLYFVSTEDPKINVFRVQKVRAPKGGHNVDSDKIVQRYYRSMDLIYDASKETYQTYFFDNSKSESNGFDNMFAKFKVESKGVVWDFNKGIIPKWFEDYYIDKSLT